MAQLVDFATLPEKDKKPGEKDWHLYFLRELLEYVATEKPTERKYTKWIRERKVFDRRFLAFCERFVDCPREPGKAPVLGEIGNELWEALQKARKKIADEAEKAQQQAAAPPPTNGPTAPPPGRRASPAHVVRAPVPPRPGAGGSAQNARPASAGPANPDDELDEDKAFADKEPPSIGTDSFQRDLLERLVELNGYLGKYVLCEIADGYLAVSEVYRRIGTSAFTGRRPSMPQFETWVKWAEWLGGIEKIGFRHRATTAGKELGKYLKGLPDTELLMPSREDDLLIEVVAPAPAPEPTGPVLVANAPTGRRSLEVVEDEDGESEASEEGLDLPPETRAPDPKGEPFWANRPHDDAAAVRGPLPEPVVPVTARVEAAPAPARTEASSLPPQPTQARTEASSLAPQPAQARTEASSLPPQPAQARMEASSLPPQPTQARTEAPSLPAPAADAREASSSLARTGEVRLDTDSLKRPAPPALETPPSPAGAPSESAASARPAVPYSVETIDPAHKSRLAMAAGHVLGWWQASGRPGERVHAREAGVDVSVYRGPARGIVVFKLLAVGAFLEAPVERSLALAFARELELRRALETFFVEDVPLERALEPLGLVEPARSVGPCVEKLVHLLRVRRALKRDGVLARLDSAANGRELARTIKREVTGDSLATGVVFAVREMARAGHWRCQGVDGLACVPWRDVRDVAARLGLLDSALAAGFEDVLAASEALSRFFRDGEDSEAPLVAYARSVGWGQRRDGDLA